MHRLTCNDADRLAADLERAGTRLLEYAALQRRFADGLRVTGDFRWADWNAHAADTTRSEGQQLLDYTARLRTRADLWTARSRPKQDRARVPDQFKPNPTRRAKRQAA